LPLSFFPSEPLRSAPPSFFKIQLSLYSHFSFEMFLSPKTPYASVSRDGRFPLFQLEQPFPDFPFSPPRFLSSAVIYLTVPCFFVGEILSLRFLVFLVIVRRCLSKPLYEVPRRRYSRRRRLSDHLSFFSFSLCDRRPY